MRILTAALFITVSLHAATRPPAASQGGPYFWTTGTYQYDGSGNITTMGTHTFTYDPLNRLSASYMTTPDTVSNKTYTYDSFGNLTRQTTGDVVTLLPTGLTTNHLDATIAGYDDAGDVTQLHPPDSADTYGFTYDALGAVTAATVDGVAVSNFVYTADDERLRMENITTGVKHWRVRGLNQTVLRDFQHAGSTWSVSRHYIYRGPLLAAITPTTVEHFSLDHLGSPRLLTDVVGNKIAQHTYLPFGKELGAMTNDGEPMKFTGHERDKDPSGGTNPLDYMHARYYPPDMGRFLSVDPILSIKRAMRNPQAWNRYSYVRNMPLTYTDPDGRLVTSMSDVFREIMQRELEAQRQALTVYAKYLSNLVGNGSLDSKRAIDMYWQKAKALTARTSNPIGDALMVATASALDVRGHGGGGNAMTRPSLGPDTLHHFFINASNTFEGMGPVIDHGMVPSFRVAGVPVWLERLGANWLRYEPDVEDINANNLGAQFGDMLENGMDVMPSTIIHPPQ